MLNCYCLVAYSMYTTQIYTSLQCHLIWIHLHRAHVCLAVTCHLHFWQNDWDLLCVTVVTRGWNGYRVSTESWPWRKKMLLLGLEPETFWSQVRHSNHWAIPAPCAGAMKYICLDLDCNICVWSPDAISIIFNVTLVSERYWSFSVSSYPFRSSFVIVECVKKEATWGICSWCVWAQSSVLCLFQLKLFVNGYGLGGGVSVKKP